MASRPIEFAHDGETLRGTLHTPPTRPKGTLLFAHGFQADHREFADAPAALAERGWSCLLVDRRGHGASTGARGRLTRASSVSDIRASLAFARRQEDAPGPYGAVSHSTGCAWLAAALAEEPGFAAAAFTAPLATLRGELTTPGEYQMYLAAGGLSRLKSRLGLGSLKVPYKVKYRDMYVDPQAGKNAEKAAYLLPEVDLADIDHLLEIDGEAWARKVVQPTLVILARADRTVQNANSLKVFNALAGEKKLEFVDSAHGVYSDVRWREVVTLLDSWFSERLGVKS